jgi:cysteine synthase
MLRPAPRAQAEETMRALARCEGIFAGVSSGGCVSGALRISGMRMRALPVCALCNRRPAPLDAMPLCVRTAAEVENATIVCIICDRGVRACTRSAPQRTQHIAARCT